MGCPAASCGHIHRHFLSSWLALIKTFARSSLQGYERQQTEPLSARTLWLENRMRGESNVPVPLDIPILELENRNHCYGTKLLFYKREIDSNRKGGNSPERPNGRLLSWCWWWHIFHLSLVVSLFHSFSMFHLFSCLSILSFCFKCFRGPRRGKQTKMSHFKLELDGSTILVLATSVVLFKRSFEPQHTVDQTCLVPLF